MLLWLGCLVVVVMMLMMAVGVLPAGLSSHSPAGPRSM
jgi:hypothetical protein